MLCACFLYLGDKLALVTGSEDTTVMIGEVDGLHVRNRSIVWTHVGSVRTLAKHKVQDGYLIASAGAKTEVHLFHINNELGFRHIAQSEKAAGDIRIMGIVIYKDKVITGLSNGFIQVQEVQDKHLKVVSDQKVEGAVLCMSKSKATLAVGLSSGIVQIMSLEPELTILHSLQTHDFGVNTIQLKSNEDGWIVVTGGDDQRVVVQVMKEGKIEKVDTQAGNSCIKGVGLLMKENKIVTSGYD